MKRAPAPGTGEYAANLHGMRVLIVEDKWVVAQRIKSMLEVAGATALGPVPTVEGALDYIRTEAIDAATIDMNLRDGFADDVVEELVAKRIPYIVVTGFEALPSNHDHHAIGVLHKPVEGRALVDLLRHVERAR